MAVKLLLGILCAGVCFAQQWELGGFIGYGWYHNGTIYAPGESIQAGINNRFAAGAVVGEDLYEHLSGEVRWIYQDGHPFIEGPNEVKRDIQGNSQTFTYDLLFHVFPKEHRVRPYVAAGLGAKFYVNAGPVPIPQPFPAIAILTRDDEWKFAADIGGGVKFLVHPHLILRVDFRDYMTGFPRDQIRPVVGNTARGVLHMFTPMFGVSYWF